jgi:hypothetical protein
MEIYEIHKYEEGIFKYVVARTNRYPKDKVREDVEKMNQMLTEDLKSRGTRYEFMVGSAFDETSHRSNR